MNAHENLVDRFRAADPAPDRTDLAAAELAQIASLLEERRGRMTTDTRTPETQPTPTHRRPALAFGLAAVIVLILVGTGIILTSGTAPQEVIGPTETVPPTAPAPTSAPVVSPTTDPPLTDPRPTLAGEVMTLTTEDVGTAMSAVVSDRGRLYVAYHSIADEEVRILRCAFGEAARIQRYASCSETPEIFTLGSIPLVSIEGEKQGAVAIDIALAWDTDIPTVVVHDPVRRVPVVFACSDPDCTEVTSGVFDSPTPIEWFDLEMFGTTPVLAYYRDTADTATVNLAVCGDPVCSVQERRIVTIDENILSHGDLDLVITGSPFGPFVIGYDSTFPGPTEARMALCERGCSEDPSVIRIDEAMGVRVAAGGAGVHVWYRSGPEFLTEGDAPSSGTILDAWDLHVAVCGLEGCDESVSVAAPAAMLWAWPADVRVASLSDGTAVAAVSNFSSDLCAQTLEFYRIDLATGEVSEPLARHYLGSAMFELVTDGERVIAVMDTEVDGLQITEVPLQGEELPDASICES